MDEEGGQEATVEVPAAAAGSKTTTSPKAGGENLKSAATMAAEHPFTEVDQDTKAQAPNESKPKNITHLTGAQFLARLAQHQHQRKANPLPNPLPGPQAQSPDLNTKNGRVHELVTVRLTLLTRGLPKACARVYRLPLAVADGGAVLRKVWLAQLPRKNGLHHSGSKGGKAKLQLGHPSINPANSSAIANDDVDDDAPTPDMQNAKAAARRSLAASLLPPASPDAAASPRAHGGREHPACPGKEDLIGFVTTANYDLGLGKGGAVGSLLVSRVLESPVERGLGSGNGKVEGEERLCVIRNAGESVGWLARWDVV